MNRNRLNENSVEVESTNTICQQMKVSMALKYRKIHLCGEINDDSIFECVFYLEKFRKMDQISEVKLPIEIYIDTNGGSIYSCLKLVSLIEQMKNEGYYFKTINASRALSAGFIISIIGNERLAYKYSEYMIHDALTMSVGKLQEIEEDIECVKRLRGKLYGIVTNYTKITLSQLEEWQLRKYDKYFDAKEALEFGIADKIL